jgi:hypothetical protein
MKFRMKSTKSLRPLAARLMLAAFTLGVAGCSTDYGIQSGVLPQWLFMESAEVMHFDGRTLVMERNHFYVTMFSLPLRRTKMVLLSDVVAEWSQAPESFQKNPPNAAVTVMVDGTAVKSVITMSNPRMDGDTVAYDVKILEGSLPKLGQETSLFIDDMSFPGMDGLQH